VVGSSRQRAAGSGQRAAGSGSELLPRAFLKGRVSPAAGSAKHGFTITRDPPFSGDRAVSPMIAAAEAGFGSAGCAAHAAFRQAQSASSASANASNSLTHRIVSCLSLADAAHTDSSGARGLNRLVPTRDVRGKPCTISCRRHQTLQGRRIILCRCRPRLLAGSSHPSPAHAAAYPARRLRLCSDRSRPPETRRKRGSSRWPPAAIAGLRSKAAGMRCATSASDNGSGRFCSLLRLAACSS